MRGEPYLSSEKQDIADNNLELLRSRGVSLPRFDELANPIESLKNKTTKISRVDPDLPEAENLFRIHWYNAYDRKSLVSVPDHIVLSPTLTGVEAKIVVVLGNRFPLIHAHKVLAAYGCLIPHILTGDFDISQHRAIWPSTGNYCRGGIAISRILGCRGVAVLPEGMSQERFEWLERWVPDPSDIIRTPGTESNVKEIYDACNELKKNDQNIILNQFSEVGNYLVHRAITGPALAHVFDNFNDSNKFTARAYVAASGSAGTLAAGDFLKEKLGTDICVVEALECPTLLYNGYGEHNIQGMGDKHVPLIHNVMNSDFVIGVSDRATDNLNLLFNTESGREYLQKRTEMLDNDILMLGNFGLSAIANILASIKYSNYMGLGTNDVILTVATDGAELYETELEHAKKYLVNGNFNELKAAEVFGQYILGNSSDHVLELNRVSRERIFNLGYYTWVEQQGVSTADFDERRAQSYWNNLMHHISIWDKKIENMR